MNLNFRELCNELEQRIQAKHGKYYPNGRVPADIVQWELDQCAETLADMIMRERESKE